MITLHHFAAVPVWLLSPCHTGCVCMKLLSPSMAMYYGSEHANRSTSLRPESSTMLTGLQLVATHFARAVVIFGDLVSSTGRQVALVALSKILLCLSG